MFGRWLWRTKILGATVTVGVGLLTLVVLVRCGSAPLASPGMVAVATQVAEQMAIVLPTPRPDPMTVCRLDPANLRGLPPRSDGRTGTTFHTCGSHIVNQNGEVVQITGVSWFGMETGTYAPHGLWTRNWHSMLDQIVVLGFNTIRLPFSDDALLPGRTPQSINYDLNPDLSGKTSLEVMDALIQGASERGLKVILDRHRPDAQAQSELWYTDAVSEPQWIANWVMLAARYKGNAAVMGVDLHNEPRGPATWGSGDPATDWRLAAERAGNAITDVNPYLLIFVQGVERYADDWYWWGGNLEGVQSDPVRLGVPDRVVYSPHDYGPGVFEQSWFVASDFPTNLPAIWDVHWGFIANDQVAPVVLGEFGGRSVGVDPEGLWQRALMDYAQQHGVGWLSWSFNPDSGDTGGLLSDDWLTVVQEKAQLYQGHLAAPLDVGSAGVFGQPPGRLTVRARSTSQSVITNNLGFIVQVVNDGPNPVDLRDIELRYWFKPGGLDKRKQQIDVDYAAVGNANVKVAIGPPDADGVAAVSIRFADQAGAVRPYTSSGDIQVRLHTSDWSNYDQAGDFSFKNDGVLSDWDHVGLYRDGQLVWGMEPPQLNLSRAGAPP
jgi:endoglucanase